MRLFAAMLLGLASSLAQAQAPADAKSERPWRVVILNDADPTLPAFVAMGRALRAALTAPGNQWKIVFAEQRAHGFYVWSQPFVPLRFPKLFNLRSDPFETADHEGMDYERWAVEHLFLMVPAQQYVGQFLASFKEFPPSQKPGSFSIDQALQKLQEGGGNR